MERNRKYRSYGGGGRGRSKGREYDGVALGCPAMGAEQLEETEFQPMWDAAAPVLTHKKTALFGSWGWGGGEWMHTWEGDCEAAGIHLACDSVTCMIHDFPS